MLSKLDKETFFGRILVEKVDYFFIRETLKLFLQPESRKGRKHSYYI